jgi:hypothetical protein
MLFRAMAKAADQANTDANSDYSNWEKTALGNYNNDMSSYTSNVNSTLAAGNPYQSKSYLTNQNLETSGAMDAANTAAAGAARDTALRTGTNTAAVAAQNAENARAGQRDLTTYNASRDTQNEDKWLTDQQQLYGDQLAGANSEAGIYGTDVSGRSNSLGNLTSLQNSEDQMWAGIAGSALGAGGAAGAAALKA